jgi:hypothetical protein
MRRKIKVGDTVTWGHEAVDAEVVEVTPDGVYVDTHLEDGTHAPRYFVTWEGGRRGRGPGVSPVRKVS